MKVLHFAFDASGSSAYLPHVYDKNCVVYTGTHDNDTTLGWYRSLSRKDRKFARSYLDIRRGADIGWVLIRAALSSVADTAIIPMQDYLGLGADARVNIPSTLGENWKWRMYDEEMREELAVRIRLLTELYGR